MGRGNGAPHPRRVLTVPRVRAALFGANVGGILALRAQGLPCLYHAGTIVLLPMFAAIQLFALALARQRGLAEWWQANVRDTTFKGLYQLNAFDLALDRKSVV